MSENPELVDIANDLTVVQADTGIWHELSAGEVNDVEWWIHDFVYFTAFVATQHQLHTSKF